MLRVIGSLYREAFSGLPRPVWLLALVNLVNRSGTMVLPFLALYLTEERGFGVAAAGRALAVYGVGSMAGSYLGGWLSDRLAPLTIMQGSLLGTAGAFLLLATVRGESAVLAAMLALSVVGEAFRPAGAAALAAASDPAERARAFSLYRLAINLGMSLGPALGGFLAASGYGWLFLVDGATCAVAAGVLGWSFRGVPRRLAAPAAGAPAERSPWQDPPFLLLMSLSFVFAVVLFQLMGTYPLTLRDHYGMDKPRIGLVMAINALGVALFEMVLVHSLRGRDPVRLMAWGSLLLCVGFGLLPLGSSFGFVVLTVMVWTLGEMLAMPAASTTVANRAGQRNLGSYMGVYMLSFAVALVVAPLVGSWAYERLGQRTLWFGCAALGPVLWAGIHALAPVLRRGTQAAPPSAAPVVDAEPGLGSTSVGGTP